jgi:outer membrane protein
MIKKPYLILIVLLIITQLSYATNKKQILTQKIVCFKTDEVIKNSPEFIKAEKILQNLSDQSIDKFKKIIDTFQKKADQYQKEAHLKSTKENKKRTNELIKLKQEIEQYQYKSSINITKKQAQLLNPLYKKIENAILQIINKDRSIKRVDDCSIGKGVIVNRGTDITNNVMKILGIKKKIK